MKVYISADIEGTTGVVTWGQCGGPRSQHYDFDFARRMMTHDVNAAVRGARAAGATEILIKDSHNTSKNLLIDQLEPGVELISGTGSGTYGMMTGIDESFACCMLIGYHGMAGSHRGIMEHTITGNVHRFSINGMPAGEIAMSAAAAGALGVPLVCVSSDDVGCAEAQSLVPAVTTATVKYGIGRYMGRLLHPSVTGPIIEEAARRGVESAAMVKPYLPAEPVTIRIEHNRSEETDAACMLPGWTRLDAYAYERTCATWDEAHVWARRAMAVAGSGASNND